MELDPAEAWSRGACGGRLLSLYFILDLLSGGLEGVINWYRVGIHGFLFLEWLELLDRNEI